MSPTYGDWSTYPEVEHVLKEARQMRPGSPVRDQVANAAIALSQAISLKRIADSLDRLAASIDTTDRYGLTGTAAISMAVRDGIREGMGK